MAYDTGYEKCAHLYDLFDTKENLKFFFHYASEAGEIFDIGAGTGRIRLSPSPSPSPPGERKPTLPSLDGRE